MLVIFAVIIGGIITGRLLSSWRLVFVSRMITVIIWLLLFLLGLEVGSDPAVVGGMATLGRTAFVIFACSVAGSICMSWLLWRCVRRGTASQPPAEGMPEQAGAVAAGIEAPQPRVTTSAGTGMPGPAVAVECPGQNAGRIAGEHVVSGADAALSMWGALRGSLVIVAFFVAGCLAGLSSALPFDVAGSRLSTYVLYALMFCVGITLGNDTTLAGRVRRLDPRLALLPVMTAVGTLAGAALSTLLLPPLTAGDTMAVGAGFGYYSLSSIFIADFRARSWERWHCSAMSCASCSHCWPHPLSPGGSGRWPPFRSAAPRLSIPPCRSSRSPQENPMPWCRSSTAACSISASRSW